ncbi:hypothetical protein BD779DRAFT_1677813 [Infundibulicybe gibba]|nr:hypothetical protein BD779DRAFT_1677813 [Infundibulicybe gibba]
MSSRPLRKAVSDREPTDKLLQRSTRRTSAQVKKDKAAAVAASDAAAKAIVTDQAKKKTHIAELEDHLRKEDQAYEKTAMRPDLAQQQVIKTVQKKHILPPRWGKQPIAVLTATKITEVPAAQEVPGEDSGAMVPASGHSACTIMSQEPTEGDESGYRSPDETPDTPDASMSTNSAEFDFIPPSDDSDEDVGPANSHGLNDDDEPDADPDYVTTGPNIRKDPGLRSDSEPEDFDYHEHLNVARTARRNKKSTNERGHFRKEINATRSAPPTSGILVSKDLAAKKRKQTVDAEEVTTTTKPIEKRAKHAEPAGLLAGWKQSFAKDRAKSIAARNASVNTPQPAGSLKLTNGNENDENDPLEYAGGVFDEDEPTEVVHAARITKMSAAQTGALDPGRAHRVSTVKIFEPAQVKLERSSSGRGRTRREKYGVVDLPFPHGSVTLFNQRWKKVFKPSLIAWAAQFDDPFGTNSIMENTVEGLWCQVFPTLVTSVQSGGKGRGAIIQTAGDVLLNWRSSMGKEAIRLILQAFREQGMDPDDAPDAAAYLLEQYRFIYEFPHAAGNLKGAFRSHLVSYMFAIHLKKTFGNVHLNDTLYEHPVGALGVAAAVLERGLELVKLGKIKLNQENLPKNNGKKRKVPDYHAYADAHWGEKTRGWVGAAKRLNQEQWDAILQAATNKIDLTSLEDGDEDATDGFADPRTFIELYLLRILEEVPESGGLRKTIEAIQQQLEPRLVELSHSIFTLVRIIGINQAIPPTCSPWNSALQVPREDPEIDQLIGVPNRLEIIKQTLDFPPASGNWFWPRS